ncbi:hypothetical protein [Prosthecobacter sp.]|uniref:hypothetical protein n=1 Tax=Prosthecobacter sp. TaxID=1965333 RepID=UPI003784E365
MPKFKHTFSIRYNYRYPDDWGPNSIGIYAKSLKDIDDICAVADLENNEYRKIDVELDENDPRLVRLYKAIEEKYQFKPSPHTIVPMAERRSYFGVVRKVEWTAAEINEAEFLRFSATRQIAHHENPDDEQWEREDYVVELDKKQYTAVQLGLLSPFQGLAVAEPLKSGLLSSDLAGLNLTPVIFTGGGSVKKPLWALKSHVVLPAMLNPLQNEHGEVVAADKPWARFESRHVDDGNCDPPVLRYRRAEVQRLGHFDIAMTHARLGNGQKMAYRWCIVSQKFRAALKQLKVPALSYEPVVME